MIEDVTQVGHTEFTILLPQIVRFGLSVIQSLIT